MLKSSVYAVIILIAFMTPAIGGTGTTTDSSENHRIPELFKDSREASDYQKALRLIRHKQYADAIPHLQAALADKPNDAHVLNALGYAKGMMGDYDSSLYYYQRALTADPNYTEAHENLGQLYLAKGDLASAQKELSTLATLCPSGCDEHDTLAKAVADYKPTALAGSSAATTPTSPPPVSGPSSAK